MIFPRVSFFSRVVVVGLCLFGTTVGFVAHAQTVNDTDGDGLLDLWEAQVFHTDPFKTDTDADGYDDRKEILSGYDPLGPARLVEADTDGDKLTNRLELRFGTDPSDADTDGDSLSDGKEVMNATSPTSTNVIVLQKSLFVNLAKQEVSRQVMGITISTAKISSGLPRTPTPVGRFKILQKHPRAWSNSAKLWMPYWMHFSGRGHGFHELPEWPGGKKEGASHIGKPASHGCIRLGVGPAKELYEWSPIGTPVTIVAR